jgi:hypothetical protein
MSDSQLIQIGGVFDDAQMTELRNGEVFRHANFKRDYQAKWGPDGEYTRPLA